MRYVYPMTKCPDGSSYQKGCRCAACRERARKSENVWRLRKLERERYGATFDSDKLDPHHTAELIRRARARGVGLREMVRITGITRATISKIENGKTSFVTRRTHDALTRAFGDEVVSRSPIPGTLVDADKFMWIIGALRAQGWSMKEMQKMIEDAGHGSGEFLNTWYQKRSHLAWKNAQKLLWLKAVIGDQRSTGPRRKHIERMSRKKGYYPLIHYTDTGELMLDSVPYNDRFWRHKKGKIVT